MHRCVSVTPDTPSAVWWPLTSSCHRCFLSLRLFITESSSCCRDRLLRYTCTHLTDGTQEPLSHRDAALSLQRRFDVGLSIIILHLWFYLQRRISIGVKFQPSLPLKLWYGGGGELTQDPCIQTAACEWGYWVTHGDTRPHTSCHVTLMFPVCLHQVELQLEELFVAVEMLSAVALINQSLEVGHLQRFSSLLVSPSAGLSDVDDTLMDRYDLYTCLSTHLSVCCVVFVCLVCLYILNHVCLFCVTNKQLTETNDVIMSSGTSGVCLVWSSRQEEISWPGISCSKKSTPSTTQHRMNTKVWTVQLFPLFVRS